MSSTNAFFYGTLMHPRILKQIIMNDGRHLQFCPAVLLVRRVYVSILVTESRNVANSCRTMANLMDSEIEIWKQGQTYPGIVPVNVGDTLVGRPLSQEERCVRGTLVIGLTPADVVLLDDFEDDEYERVEVQIHPLAPVEAVVMHPDEDQLVLLHAAPLPKGDELAPAVKAQTYEYSPSLIHQLEPVLWELEDFMKNNASRWFNYRPDRENGA